MANGIEGLKASNALTGQLITVAAGLLAFTITFAEKFTPKDQPIVVPGTLKASWVCFAVSIVFGFWTLMALNGTLNQLDRGEAETNPARWNIRVPAIAMFSVFLLGTVLLIWAGWTIAGR
ncbi:hypothetical protein AAFG13_18100 [Bradyrhizobium sp. B124]|uniref:hypothetical protein n=1 Tax=Bradyrhizobium sp. B124 TaxID=3140245 RepID=UPI003182C157